MRSSMINVQIGERVYPAVRNPRCKICTHPGRAQIEEQLLLNTQYPEIVRLVSGREYVEVDGVRIDWPEISAQQLGNHYNRGHCPIDTNLLAQLTEERERELGINYADTTGRVVDQVIFSKLVLAQSQERLVRGEVKPTLKEGLAAAKLLSDIQTDKTQDEVDRLGAYVEAMEIYFQAVQHIMTPDQWSQLAAMLNTNPTLREIAQRLQEEEQIDDAEVIGA